ncbi:hypothetical protein HNV12_16805 [Methanococcoides sp. SA1]|nr:hypothetical protein [Methanococcoides sp. SA1]
MNAIVVEDDLSSSPSLGEVDTSKSSEDQLSNIVEVVESDSQVELLSKEELDGDIEELLDFADENVDASSKLPDEINSAWEKTLKELGAKKSISEDLPLEIKTDSFFKKFLNMISTKAFEMEDYDLAKHGPLVEITLPEDSAYKEMEFWLCRNPLS